MSTRTLSVIRWLARGLSVALLLFWGAFFLEHLEWFRPGQALPPWWVWFAQAMHLLLLVGYGLAWRWERLGSLLIIAGAVLWFLPAAGAQGIPYILISIPPALLFLFCAGRTQPRAAPRPV